jgi:hypothetical protein
MAGIIAAKSRGLKVFLPIGPDFVFGPRDFNFKCAYGWIPVSVPDR